MSIKDKISQIRTKTGIIAQTAVLSVIVILIFIGANLLATSLEKRHSLNADLSFNALTTQSSITEAELAGLQQEIDIYFFVTGAGDTLGDTVILRKDIETILNRYSSLSTKIRIHQENIVVNPLWSTRFSDMLNGAAVSEDSVLVVCDANQRARLLTGDDFLRYQYDLDSQAFLVSAYSIEKSLTEAIAYVSNDETPMVRILTGHGELSEAESATLVSHLNDAGYQAERILLHSELETDIPLIILCPQFDLSEQELLLLREFTANGGSILYICGYADRVTLPRFNALLADYGVSVLPGVVVASEKDPTGYYNDSQVSLLPYMQATPETQELLANGQEILLMPGARAIAISGDRDDDIYTESLLKSAEGWIRHYEDGIETLDRQEGDEEGSFDLAVLARRYHENGAGGTLIAVGSSAMFTEEWIYENTYQDAFLRVLLRAISTVRPISLDIALKPAARPGLTIGSLSWAAAAACALPLLVLLAAFIILWPRRHL